MSLQDKFIELFKEMFQLNQSDLDFGIYKVIKIKSKEIETFLSETLTKKISNALNDSQTQTLQTRMDELKKDTTVQTYLAQPNDALLIVPIIKEYVELEQKLKNTQSSSDIENALYNDLYTFFKRYYENGDFISHRRYSNENEYSIPYNGEEVKLHWATADQYYIKSSESFKDYSFKVGEVSVHFKLTDASTEQNNNKEERKFIQQGEIEVSENSIIIPFVYEKSEKGQFPVKSKSENPKKSLNEEALDNAKLKITDPQLIEAIEKHLKKYTSKNSFDYFIHKDLKSFLNKELDVYIKNNLLKDILSSNNSEELIRKAKTFKDVATPIIDFLSQLEEFQKALWLKKKFIYDSNYCMTLDKIDSKHYDKILTCKAQLDEWTKLFGVEVSTKEDLTSSYLVLDTKFFSKEFKYTLLSEIADIDANTDGLLINSENFGALNLLQERYKEQVKTVYIDPPYNTGNDGFIYKDNLQHSTWMSMMYDRLVYGRELMSEDGVQFSSIDDKEFVNLKMINNLIFEEKNFMGNIVRATGQTTGQDSDGLGSSFDFLLLNSKTENSSLNGLPLTDKDLKRFENKDDVGYFAYDQMRKTGSNDKREDRPNMYYAIKDPDGIDVYPIAPAGYESCWRFERRTYDKLVKENFILWKKSKRDGSEIWWPYVKYYLEGRTKRPSPLWNDLEGNKKAARDLRNIFSGNKVFDFPKPVEMIVRCIQIAPKMEDNGFILDYFAGSGTTGHAVINLNREDQGKRKYILVEMGEYFDTVTKPRIQKVIYTNNWKDGKPQDTNGISQIFKYFSLESYEDTLNNLEFKQKGILPEFEDEYLINYMLLNETPKYNLAMFEKPFEYKLNIAKNNEAVETNIDLVETFNYLLGLHVSSIKMKESYLIVKGTAKEEAVTVIWRKDISVELKLDGEVLEGVVYINGDTNVDGALSIESEFANCMWGRSL